jgi:eukaryotic-like serine/threonine-protein kinase
VSSRRTKLQDRYELRETLGRGGMGIVYKAYDRLMNREVALKTILDIDNPETLALFYKEWSTLVTMVHPNVINIYDIGEFEQDGNKKPFFVMPLLPGVTLDKLIKEGSPRLSVAGVIAIVDQAARGLHAAHEQGLIHRDVKPSNIFVMDDGSVKIIDFGIVRSATAHSKTTLKGTLYYMAPEQLAMKPPSPLSDMFALGIVTYEAFTRQRPFRGSSDGEVIEQIQRHIPPPISEVNHEVSFSISQVVHKAMAKQPWHRFFNMREYGDALMKALRGEPLEYFDASKIKPRLERATQSYEKGDYEFSSEVLSELEAEGHLDLGIGLLRGQVDQAVRQVRIKQMLENARRFYEANEYPLALRKIQEALELDPNDATALSLKSQVERERREKKISEWITLSRQHLENQAFRQAREALDNVLQIKPNDTDALNLAAEVGRREQEVSQIREQKSKLYHGAMQAWEKGDVTAALTKLEVLIAMDRDQPEADTGRSSSYQGFYNKVHSEHNTLKNSLEEAQRLLSADNYEAALAICSQYLSRYPNHVLFQSLKFDVEERQRQGLSRVIAETDRRADEEPDLDRRLGILDEVLKLYPGEPHFERAIQLVRDKRDLVNSIITKARFFEERGQFVEAMDQWQIVKSIHEKQPGLAFEIERVIKRRDQQAVQSSKARWVEQTDKYLEGGDYERAMKTIHHALSEFPNEPELMELDKLVQKNQERAAQAVALLNRAREHGDKAGVDETLEGLRQAYELDGRNTVIRTVLVNTLLDHARKSMQSSPDAAEAALAEILHLDPNHVQARSLTSQMGDRKREEFVAWCLSQSRRLQTDGDISGALAIAAQGLASYPNEPRLQQLQGALQRALEAATRTPAPVPKVVPTIPPQPAPAPAPVKAEAKVDNVKPEVPAKPSPPPAPAAPPQLRMPPPPDWTVTSTSAVGSLGNSQSGMTPMVSPQGPVLSDASTVMMPVAQAPPVPPPVPPTGGSRNSVMLGILSAVAVLLVLLGVAWFMRKKPAPAVPPEPSTSANLKVNLRSTPAGAQITVNGEACGTSTCELSLAPGNYKAEARLADYQSAATTFTISAGQTEAPEVTLTLLPPPAMLSISTDLSDGSVQVDNAPAGQIQNGDIEIAKLTPAPHTIFVQNGPFSSKFSVEIADGALPKISKLQTNAMHGLAVAHSGSTAHVYSTFDGAKLTLDGKPLSGVTADGLELKGLTPGSHEVVMESPAGSARAAFDAGPASGVVAAFMSQQTIGVLNITANEDGVDIYLNGVKTSRTTQRGKARLNLPPKTYVVRVQKDGFITPPEQTAQLPKAEVMKLDFRMVPARATLTIHRGVPGSEVLVDGKNIGIVSANGEFSAGYVEPGRRTVSLNHPRYKNSQTDQTFVAGKTVELDGTLQTLMGTLKIEVTPADAHVRIRRQGDTQDQDVHDSSVQVPEGTYSIAATAPRYQDGQATIRVLAGGTAVVPLTLRRVETNVKTAPAPSVEGPRPIFTLEDWLKFGWTREGTGITHIGGEFVLLPSDLAKALVQFTVQLQKGKRIEWVTSYRDEKNYVLFQFDDTNFVRTEVVNGKHVKTVKTAHGARRDVPNTFVIKIAPQFIVHSIQKGQQWKTLDEWQPADGVPPGKFGFHIPGKDQIGLSDFKIMPN